MHVLREQRIYIILMTFLESNGHIILIDAGTDTSSLCRTGTGNVSALIILVANNLTFPEHSLHDYIDEDMQLISEGLQFLENIARLMDNEGLRQLHIACSELNRRVAIAVASFQSRKSWSQEMELWLNTRPEATLVGKDVTSSFSALNLIQAFAQADVKPFTPAVSWMQSLGNLEL